MRPTTCPRCGCEEEYTIGTLNPALRDHFVCVACGGWVSPDGKDFEPLSRGRKPRWLRPEEVTEPGWYWIQHARRSVCPEVVQVGGPLMKSTSPNLWWTRDPQSGWFDMAGDLTRRDLFLGPITPPEPPDA